MVKSEKLASVLGEHQALFEERVGTLKGYEGKLLCSQERNHNSTKLAQSPMPCEVR